MKVLVAGVFDIIHTGHLHFLEQAKSLGDELIVLVACDEIVKKEKRLPINSQEERAHLVGALRPVDSVIIGINTTNQYRMVLDISPDIVALGFNQNFDMSKLEKGLKERGYKGKVVRLDYYKEQSTTKIIKKIRDSQ